MFLLKSLNDYLVLRFSLSIDLRVYHRWKICLYPYVSTKIHNHNAGELGFFVLDNFSRKPKLAHNFLLVETTNPFYHDFVDNLDLYPYYEVIHSHY